MMFPSDITIGSGLGTQAEEDNVAKFNPAAASYMDDMDRQLEQAIQNRKSLQAEKDEGGIDDPQHRFRPEDLMEWHHMTRAIKQMQRLTEFTPEDAIYWEVIKDLRMTSQRDRQDIMRFQGQVETLQSVVAELQQQIADLEGRFKLHEEITGVETEESPLDKDKPLIGNCVSCDRQGVQLNAAGQCQGCYLDEVLGNEV